MKFKLRKLLTDKQLFRAKFSMGVALCLFSYIMVNDYYVQADEALMYNDHEYTSTDFADFEKGKIVYYSMNTEVCNR